MKLDQYLESVRSLEKRVGDPSLQTASSTCSPGTRPTRCIPSAMCRRITTAACTPA